MRETPRHRFSGPCAPFSGLFVPIVLLILLSAPASAQPGKGRFFLMGDGKIALKNEQTGREMAGDLLSPDGSINEKTLDEIDRIFEFPTEEKGEHISPRLIFMLDYFSDIVAPGKVINLDSGYRSPEYNAGLRDKGANAAKTSVHMDGMALDFNIEGVSGKDLWRLVKSKDCCGIGHYGGANVHLDSSRPRFWEAATSKVRTGKSDFNRDIYVSSDYDRYLPGDTVRLSFSSVSDFGFGIKRTVALVDNPEQIHTPASVPVGSAGEGECLMIRDRKASRFITLQLPKGLSPGRYRIRVDFCNKPFDQMPAMVVSNPIELGG